MCSVCCQACALSGYQLLCVFCCCWKRHGLACLFWGQGKRGVGSAVNTVAWVLPLCVTLGQTPCSSEVLLNTGSWTSLGCWGKSNVMYTVGFRGGAGRKEPSCQCRRCKRHRFDPWVGKILWRRAWQPTLVFLPGESHRQRSLVGYSLWGCKELDMIERLTLSPFQ